MLELSSSNSTTTQDLRPDPRSSYWSIFTEDRLACPARLKDSADGSRSLHEPHAEGFCLVGPSRTDVAGCSSEVPSAPQEGPPGDIATSTRPLLQPRSGRPALIRQQTLHQIVICRKCETSGLEGHGASWNKKHPQQAALVQ
ncbi:predicted protein [Coccidioides posadasii str. Silveira]|uniref:Predicted protein n=1 Tax=Coccidioides posadasii (strain RMSCC 757 / Silveira) TaxID=443226 RepID=E9DHM7_COCPS|nr:predicted protein [Coccidioides posadasii str. Silveira]